MLNFIKRLFVVPRDEAFNAGFDWAKKALLSGQEDARSVDQKTLYPIDKTAFDEGAQAALLKLIRKGKIADNRFSRVTPPVRRCGDVF